MTRGIHVDNCFQLNLQHINDKWFVKVGALSLGDGKAKGKGIAFSLHKIILLIMIITKLPKSGGWISKYLFIVSNELFL